MRKPMKTMTKPEELVSVSSRQGLKMTFIEADIVLGYMEGHDYCLMMDDQFHIRLHDMQDGEKHDEDMDYDVRQAIEFAREMNEELLLEESSKTDRNESYVLDLMKDEHIIDGLMQRAQQVIPPVVREYRVSIIETLKMTVPVQAASWDEAKMNVEQRWKDGEFILDAECFAGVMFTSAGL